MKKPLLLLLFLSFFLTNKNSFGQNDHPADYKELVLAIPAVNPRTYNEIKNLFTAMGGIKLIGYCDQHKCFLIKYDANKIDNPDTIAKAVEDYKNEYKTFVKQDVTIAQLISSCTKLSAEENTETNPSSGSE